MLAMSPRPVLFLNETTRGWSGEENWAVEKEQELRTRLKEDANDSGLTVHSNRLDVRMVNGTLYLIRNITNSTKMRGQDVWLRQDRGKIGCISHTRQA
jgi:hypothetical protein